ncbi:four-carbon acid sugar kinase family protein [Rhodococcoides kyotonense]|uniref:4-hydroxythreonine-4-phosphate dehydrogenase n=1 Tax=Rhodococcoides kyotonense TaxID=398843 RepID=A0A239IFC3_9NOCA|nr:four-carbon acid sugar kinase family protein [Rhodococcus kyotonensis]SNS91743.1 4-hydroxythreonine-4-phosphate dehydrogenase [Rhodococcus kyotonensis]
MNARPDLLILADDLSGAAECAAVFLRREVDLAIDIDTLQSEADVRVVDLGTRIMSGADASARLAATLDGLPARVSVLKKIDSMLRGNIGPEVEALAATGPVVVAAALPVLNRVVVDGVLHIDDVPLHLSGRWGMELATPPKSVGDMFTGAATVTLAAGVGESELRAALASGAIAVCDASTDADLDAVVAAASAVPGVRLVGTSALAAAVARTFPEASTDTSNREPAPALVVVGTAEAVAVEQVRRLERAGACHVQVDIDDLVNARTNPDTVRSALADGVAVLTVSGPVDPSRASSVAAALGDLVAAVVRGRSVGLVLTGGETARRVIDALGVSTMEPIAEVHHGAVVSRTPDGSLIATRPGSFGDHDSLISMSNYLRGIDNSFLLSHSEALA